ncbi:MAG: NADH-quinone oxidoreductase subunit NuoE [Phycisphaerae bacterium]|nr:NADH-quinone oxidoreductase subunit NuoE [Phycisphaerae bacterium]
MLVTEQERMKQDIQEWVSQYGSGRDALMPILQNVQKKYRCVSDFAMQQVADMLGIHPVEVYGVVTFYSFLDTKPQGRFVIRLCQTIACDMAGKGRVAQQLRNDLEIDFGQTTRDGMFTLEWANCLGMCDQGPAMLVNDEVHTKVTPEKVHAIIEACRRTVTQYAGAASASHKEGH